MTQHEASVYCLARRHHYYDRMPWSAAESLAKREFEENQRNRTTWQEDPARPLPPLGQELGRSSGASTDNRGLPEIQKKRAASQKAPAQLVAPLREKTSRFSSGASTDSVYTDKTESDHEVAPAATPKKAAAPKQPDVASSPQPATDRVQRHALAVDMLKVALETVMKG